MSLSSSTFVAPVNVIAVSTSKLPTFTVTPPTLDRAVKSLTNDMQEAVAALYRLETAVINSLSQSPIAGVLLGEFNKARQLIREQWLKLRDFIRNCGTYTEVYCIHIEQPRFPKVLLQKAQRVSAEAESVKSNHNILWKELQNQRVKLLAVLGSSDKETRTAFPGHKMPHLHLPANMSPTISQAALQWSNPDGPVSMMEANAAFERMTISLGDIVVFWKHHVDELSGPFLAFSVTDDVKATWGTSKSTLNSAVCSIQTLADEVFVNAVGAPSTRYSPNFRRFIPRIRTFISGRLSKSRTKLVTAGRSRS